MSTTSFLFVVIVTGVWQGALCDGEEKTGLKFRITDKLLTAVENATKDNDLMVIAAKMLMRSNPGIPIGPIIAGIGLRIRPNFSLSFEEPNKFHVSMNDAYFEVNYRNCYWDDPLIKDHRVPVQVPPYVRAEGAHFSFATGLNRTEDNKLELANTQCSFALDFLRFQAIHVDTILDPFEVDRDKTYWIGDPGVAQINRCLERERNDLHQTVCMAIKWRLYDKLGPKLKEMDYNICNPDGKCTYFGLTEDVKATSEYMELGFSMRPSIVGAPSELDQQFQPAAINVDVDNSKMFYVVVNEEVVEHKFRVVHAMNMSGASTTSWIIPDGHPMSGTLNQTLNGLANAFCNLVFGTLSHHLGESFALPDHDVQCEMEPLDTIVQFGGDPDHPDRHIIVNFPIAVSRSTVGAEGRLRATLDVEVYFNLQMDNSENLFVPLVKLEWHVIKADLNKAFGTDGEISISDQVKEEISEALKDGSETMFSLAIKGLEQGLNTMNRLMHRSSAQHAIPHALMSFFAPKNVQLQFTEGNMILGFDLGLDPAVLRAIMPQERPRLI